MLSGSPPRPAILANPWSDAFPWHWIIYSYDLAMQVLRHDGRGFEQGDLYDGEGACRYPDAVVVAASGETHRQLRREIIDYFTRERVEHYTRTLIDREADAVVERLLRAGGGDLQQEAVASLGPSVPQCWGLTAWRQGKFSTLWESEFHHKSYHNLPPAEHAFQTMKELVAPSLVRRRTDPQNDLFTKQLQVGADDEVMLERAAMVVYASLHFTPMAVCRSRICSMSTTPGRRPTMMHWWPPFTRPCGSCPWLPFCNGGRPRRWSWTAPHCSRRSDHH